MKERYLTNGHKVYDVYTGMEYPADAPEICEILNRLYTNLREQHKGVDRLYRENQRLKKENDMLWKRGTGLIYDYMDLYVDEVKYNPEVVQKLKEKLGVDWYEKE